MDEPVRRFFEHAVAADATPAGSLRLAMAGRIKVRRWLPFSAVQECDGRSFAWRARIGLGPLTAIRVEDAYADGRGVTAGKLFGVVPMFRSDDEDTARSAAGRSALENVAFAPSTVQPGSGVEWSAVSDDEIVATFDLPPEHPRVRVCIDARGAVEALSAQRWGNPDGEGFRYLACNCAVRDEQTFGDLTIPAAVTVAWDGFDPFFEARISAAETAPGGRSPQPPAPA